MDTTELELEPAEEAVVAGGAALAAAGVGLLEFVELVRSEEESEEEGAALEVLEN